MTYKEQYREKLIKETPDGRYTVDGPNFFMTGKMGIIEFDIAMIEAAAKRCNEDPEEWFKEKLKL